MGICMGAWKGENRSGARMDEGEQGGREVGMELRLKGRGRKSGASVKTGKGKKERR